MKWSKKTSNTDEKHLLTLLDNIYLQVWYLTDDHTYGMVNRIYAEFHGYKIKELIFRDMYDIFQKDIVEVHRQGNKEVFATGKITREEKWIRHVSGEQRLLIVTKLPQLHDDGSVDYVVCFAEDITERKQAENALRENEEQFSAVLNANPDLMIVLDAEGRYRKIFASDPNLLILPENNLLGRTIHEVMPQEKAQSIQEVINQTISTGKLQQIEYALDIDGVQRWFAGRVVKFIFQNTECILWSARDITERKQAEEKLIDSEERYRNLFEENPLSLWEEDWSEVKKFLDELQNKGITVSKKYFDENPIIFSECISLLKISNINKATLDLLGYKTKKELIHNIHAINNEKTIETLKRGLPVIAEGKRSFIEETEFITADGKTIQVISNYKLVENYKKSICSTTDITEQKRTEKEIRRMQKLDSLGTIAGGIAHDFNNLLMGIFGNLEIAKINLPEDSKSSAYLKKAHDAIHSARQLTGQLLTFAKGGTPVLDTVETATLVKHSVEFSLHGSNVVPEFTLQDNLWSIKADEGQIGQVLANLAINAKQAMPDGGTLHVTGKNMKKAEKSIATNLAGDYVCLTIRDEGTGILPKIIERIFDPYFSTKSSGHGLGLAVVHSIITQHGGRIEVSSTPDIGSTFTVFLPAIFGNESMDCEDVSRKYDETEATSALNILLMDDDKIILDLGTEMIGIIGHNIETVSNGDEALNKFVTAMENGNPFDLVIMDLTIPGSKGGKETVLEILKICPHAKAIVSSGYANDPVMARYSYYGFSGMLANPFQIE
ncbi:PAS domain S-box protein [bacterium]|nr:PAS domain S-box protein [bacterium]